jgi:hypothetical protein
MQVSNTHLRQRLSLITRENIDKHRELIISLKNEISHQITEINSQIPKNVLADEYNCIEYAFDLIYSEEYKICLDWQNAKMKLHPIGGDAEFVRYLIEANIIKECLESECSSQIILVYFCDSIPTHAGKKMNDFVISKWGKGLLLRHLANEVPSIYGNEAKLYIAPEFNVTMDAFIEFAKKNGIPYE